MTTPQPLVSVVIPTYNRAGTIALSIDSVLRQTYRNFELIIVDDCSTDDSVALIERFQDSRVRLLRHEKNAGANAARNTGLRAASGAFVAFQDSDDEWLPRKLELQIARLTAGDAPPIAAYCGMVVVGAPGEGPGSQVARKKIRYVPAPSVVELDGTILNSLLRESFVSTQTFIASREVLDQVGLFDETLPALQDWDYVLRVAREGPIAFIDEPLVIQRFQIDSITRSQRKRLQARDAIIAKNLDLLRDKPDVLAHHYQALASGLRDLGDLASATRFLSRAIRLRPFNLRRISMLVYTLALTQLRSSRT